MNTPPPRNRIPAAGKTRDAQFQSLETTRIVGIHVFKLDLPLRRDFSISGSKPGHANNVLINIRTSDGLDGWGEASPVSRVTNETQRTCITYARQLKAALTGRDACDISGCVSVMDRTIRGNPTIKSAFDIALHDLAARRAGVPLWKFLGGRTARTLPTDATIFLRPLDGVAARARELLDAGFRSIKVKFGHETRDDVDRMMLVRKICGPSIELRADANEAWDLSRARSLLPRLASLGYVFCEQPLPARNRSGLRKLARNSSIPVMADESLFSPRDAARLTAEKTFGIFNIKLSKSGGLHRACEIADIASNTGITCMVGCMNESRLGLSASAHFAAAHRIVKYYDLDSFLMQTSDWTDGGITIARGVAKLPAGPGLGARPDPGWLRKQKPAA